MNTLLRITGIDKLITFYRYIYFNGPGVVKWSGIGLILMIGLTHLLLLPWHYEAAPYLGVSFGVLFTGSLLSALGIFRGSGWGWILGSALCAVAFVAYFISRIFGLPGFPEAAGNWSAPAGTVAFGLEALFIFLHFSIITGMNVVAPDRRDEWDEDWHEYAEEMRKIRRQGGA